MNNGYFKKGKKTLSNLVDRNGIIKGKRNRWKLLPKRSSNITTLNSTLLLCRKGRGGGGPKEQFSVLLEQLGGSNCVKGLPGMDSRDPSTSFPNLAVDTS